MIQSTACEVNPKYSKNHHQFRKFAYMSIKSRWTLRCCLFWHSSCFLQYFFFIFFARAKSIQLVSRQMVRRDRAKERRHRRSYVWTCNATMFTFTAICHHFSLSVDVFFCCLSHEMILNILMAENFS